jgi:hypothetical protein
VLETGLPGMVHLHQKSPLKKINREDQKMKTNNNTSNVSKMLTVFLLVMTFSAVAMAQPQPQQSDANSRNMDQVFSSLEAFMTVAEQSIRYVAPSDEENDELEMVWERLDLLAGNIEREIRYKAPEDDGENSVNETTRESRYTEILSYHADVPKSMR